MSGAVGFKAGCCAATAVEAQSAGTANVSPMSMVCSFISCSFRSRSPFAVGVGRRIDEGSERALNARLTWQRDGARFGGRWLSGRSVEVGPAAEDFARSRGGTPARGRAAPAGVDWGDRVPDPRPASGALGGAGARAWRAGAACLAGDVAGGGEPGRLERPADRGALGGGAARSGPERAPCLRLEVQE